MSFSASGIVSLAIKNPANLGLDLRVLGLSATIHALAVGKRLVCQFVSTGEKPEVGVGSSHRFH